MDSGLLSILVLAVGLLAVAAAVALYETVRCVLSRWRQRRQASWRGFEVVVDPIGDRSKDAKGGSEDDVAPTGRGENFRRDRLADNP